MANNKRKIFNDPVHGFISIPYELIFDIIEHPYFQRLRRIQQLALSSYVYPGANHTRFHHALGAFHLMKKALATLKVKGNIITDEEELGAYIAILLHDIGHGPYSHTLENIIIEGVGHEQLSIIYMQRLNEYFDGKLSLAIEIFQGTYHKKFLHQLVSSQLDVDRLDYLTRDSFFTGVNEGVISYERIIDMMTVDNDELVIEQKGIYSIENFIIARRLMYWQVYLHKTVVCVEQMLVKTIERAKELIAARVKLDTSPALCYFFQHHVSLQSFIDDRTVLDQYSHLDDTDILSALKAWRHADDFVLSFLCTAILDRKLFKIEMSNGPFTSDRVADILRQASIKYNITPHEAQYLVWSDSTYNHAYNPAEDRINIISSDGRVVDIANASDQFNISNLSEPVVKYYFCYPKNL